MLIYEAKYCREVKFYETSVQLLSTQRENKPKDQPNNNVMAVTDVIFTSEYFKSNNQP